ncbi:MAG: LysR family transcriptional regulator [Ruminococcaceae bacterium]|nr:LysR family transcriptional regulator [Oscillospiraceae bacterium]
MYNSQLDTFICIADNGSFNKAAEKLFISSTAVIKQINALETHLDIKLLNRTNHGITLTPAGSILYRHAKNIIEYSANAIAEARKSMNVSNTTFCVGTSILNLCKPFMDVWYRISDRFPEYKLHIVPFEDDHTGILTEIESLGGKFDFLVAACDSKEWLSRCNFLKLGEYKQCVAVSRVHPLAKRKSVSIEDLFGQTVMIGKKGDSGTVDRIRSELEQYEKITIEDVPHFYDIEVFNRCEQSGAVLLTLDCWADVHPSLVTIPVKWNYTTPYGILYPLNCGKDIQNVIDKISIHLLNQY